MTSAQRREKIEELLKQSNVRMSATVLAKNLNVSRQVIVGDIALLRASGVDILSTPRGYILAQKEYSSDEFIFTIACNHNADDLKKEFYTIIDNGGSIIDVIVEHPIYGQLTGQLNIFSRFDADEFIKNTQEQHVPLLSKLTDGVHLHTIKCKDEQVSKRIISVLEKEEILLDEN